MMKRRKRNPMSGKWFALGAAGLLGLGFGGYGIYRWRKSKMASDALDAATGGGTWHFNLIPQPTQAGAPLWLAQVFAPNGIVKNIGPFADQRAAVTAAQNYVSSQGGTLT